MNTKQIVAIMAIVAVAVAGIAGAAYAYQATLTNSLNNVESNYLELDHVADTTFSGTFSDTNLQWDMDTTAKNTGTYVPAGELTEIARGLKGLAINADPYVITINSESMEAGNWFKFQVQTVSANDSSLAVSMNNAYAMKYDYNDGTNTYTDYAKLNGTSAVPLFMSGASLKSGISVSLQLFAIPVKDATIPNDALDYRFVDFVFSAVTMDAAGTVPTATANGVTLTVTDASGAKVTTLAADTARLYTAAGARICAQADVTDKANGNYKFTAPATDAGTALSFVGDTSTSEEYTQTSSATTPSIAGKYTALTASVQDGAVDAVKKFTFSKSSFTDQAAVNAALVLNTNIKFYTHFGDLDADGTVVALTASDATWDADNFNLGAHKVTFTKTINSVNQTVDIWVYITA